MFDHRLTDYPKTAGETDSQWIQRAIDDNRDGVLYIPKGEYRICEPLFIYNRCSLEMHPAAHLIATEPMDFVLTYNGNANCTALSLFNEDGSIYDNLNIFIRGGDIDGAGKAGCLMLANAHHFTLSDIALHNGKTYGLCVGGKIGGRLYELIATNVYCKCTMQGLSGNTGIYTNECDGHYTDCLVVDYTTGFCIENSANRLTRCHVWGGTVAPKGCSMKEWSERYAANKALRLSGQYTDETDRAILSFGVPEMLVDSVAFRIYSSSNVLDGCYADTAKIGYWVKRNRNVITNSGFYNNPLMGLRNTLAIRNEADLLTVTNCSFANATGTDVFYAGRKAAVQWANNSIDVQSLFESHALPEDVL